MKFSVGILATTVSAVLLLSACKREERGFRVQPPSAQSINTKSLSELELGVSSPQPEIKNDYEQNAYALSEGKRLFSSYNCNGCHSQGGGGMGPPLMDERWIYGGKPDQVFSTIVEGRPNGMPSFRRKIPDFQVWQLAAYVRSLSGQVSKDAAPSRDDHLQGKPSESSLKKQPIKEQTVPKQP